MSSLLSCLGNELRQDCNFPSCKIETINPDLGVTRGCGNNIQKEIYQGLALLINGSA